MRSSTLPAHYQQISLDLANRVAEGEFPEGSVIYGRSVMASEYNVSPETIRRALCLLADMKVVEVRPKYGAVVLSVDSARRYLDSAAESVDVNRLREQLRELLEEYADLSRRTMETARALIRTRETHMAAGDSLPNYEIVVPENSQLIGRSIGELQFWQRTGGTIVAIRRKQRVIVSPGPYLELYAGDVIVLVGNDAAILAAQQLVEEKGVEVQK